MTGPRLFAVVFALNALLAAAVQAVAPAHPILSDRDQYESVGRQPFAPNCPWSVYCYRVLVPVVLEQVPIESETRWRTYQWAANGVAGSILAITTAGLANGWPAAVLASLMVQMSFGFAFTAYDPYSAEPMLFVFSALLTWCWLANRPLTALGLALVGVFVKETVALVSGAAALAAMVNRGREGWWHWVVQAAIATAVLLGFHWLMDTYFGWDLSRNAAARFDEGAWLALWWNNNPGLWRKAFFLFAPFGFAWAYAVVGYRTAPRDLRHLALGAVLPFLALNYVQNPERALAGTFFVIVPLATIALSRVPLGVALAAAIANGLFTAKVGTSTTWLPSSSILLVPAAACAAWVFWHWRAEASRVHD